jgi:hypothetical protein
MHLCVPQVANGGAVPTDPTHTNPTLDGTCTTAAGALTCVSGVCDTDNECGYKNGDGPCVAGDAGASTLCRSGLCAPSTGGTSVCVACVADTDCPGGQTCGPSNACIVPSADAGAGDGGLSDVNASPDAQEPDAQQDAAGDAPADAVGEAAAEAAEADAGEDAASSTPDSSTAEDATTTPPHPHVADGGYIRGGGCSAAGGRGSSDAALEMVGAFALLGMLGARRRRARATR